jgi:hypothetical protein
MLIYEQFGKRSPLWQEAVEADATIDELMEIPAILEKFNF